MTITPFGLLKDVDLESGVMYSTTFEYSTKLKEAGLFWSAAELDGRLFSSTEAYVETILERLKDFSKSDLVADRLEITTDLRSILNKPDEVLHILLGGKSIGKTKMIRRVVEPFLSTDNKDGPMVIYVNGRQSSLVDSLKQSLDKLTDEEFFKHVNFSELFQGIFICGTAGVSAASCISDPTALGTVMGSGEIAIGTLAGFRAIVRAIYNKEKQPDMKLLQLMIRIAQKRGQKPVLIVDEANNILRGSDSESLNLLQLITSKTKEEAEMTVFLCSSSHSYPDELKYEGRVHLHLSDIIYIPELSPKAMWNFLRQERHTETGDYIIGMGPNLATALISAFGGNLALIVSAVRSMARMRQKFLPTLEICDIEGHREVEQMVESARRSDEEGEIIRKTLSDLSRQGFCELPTETENRTELMQRFKRSGVASEVTVKSLYADPGWRDAIHGEDTGILVVSSMALRHQIALLLTKKPPSPKKKSR